MAVLAAPGDENEWLSGDGRRRGGGASQPFSTGTGGAPLLPAGFISNPEEDLRGELLSSLGLDADYVLKQAPHPGNS